MTSKTYGGVQDKGKNRGKEREKGNKENKLADSCLRDRKDVSHVSYDSSELRGEEIKAFSRSSPGNDRVLAVLEP